MLVKVLIKRTVKREKEAALMDLITHSSGLWHRISVVTFRRDDAQR
ncbi:MAG: hypothetical protein ACXWMS_07995 [Syntrophales bacterium]